MAFNGNQPAVNPICFTGASNQVAQQTPFTPQPFLSQYQHPMAFNGNQNQPMPYNNLAPPFATPGYQPAQQIVPIPLQRPYNVPISNNYDSRVNQLNQEICSLKQANALELKQANLGNSRLAQKKKDLEAQCAKLRDDVAKKDLELKDFKNLMKSTKPALKDDYELKISELNQKICYLKSSEQQKRLFHLEAECTKLHADLRKMCTESDALKEFKKQNFRIQCFLKDQLAKLKADHHNELLHEAKKHKVKVEQAQNEQHSLSKKLAEIQKENRELKQTNDRSQLKLCQMQNTAKANDVAKFNEKVAEVKRNYDRQIKDFSLQISKLNAKSKKLEEENEMLKANPRTGDTDQLNFDLDTCRAQMECYRAGLEKERENKNGITAERDRFKADLTEANKSIKVSEEKRSKLRFKLKAEEDKCKEYIAEIDKLKQASGDHDDQHQFDLDTYRAQLDYCSAELQKTREEMNGIVAERDRLTANLEKANEKIENSERASAKLSRKLKVQEDKCKEYIAKSDKLKQDSGGDSEQLKSELRKEKKDKNVILAEIDRLKAELKTANDNSETYIEQLVKLEVKQKEHTEEIDKLKEDSENCQKLKAQLELATISYEELTRDNKKLAKELSAKSAECERVSKLYKEHLTSRQRNVGKPLMNLPGPSSVMTAANRNTVIRIDTIDPNGTIDLTKNDSDEVSPSSSKKKRKYK